LARRACVSGEENKAVCNRHAEAISKGDLEAIDELMAPELAQEAKQEIADFCSLRLSLGVPCAVICPSALIFIDPPSETSLLEPPT
jgi:hypothetical protein